MKYPIKIYEREEALQHDRIIDYSMVYYCRTETEEVRNILIENSISFKLGKREYYEFINKILSFFFYSVINKNIDRKFYIKFSTHNGILIRKDYVTDIKKFKVLDLLLKYILFINNFEIKETDFFKELFVIGKLENDFLSKTISDKLIIECSELLNFYEKLTFI